MTRPKLETTTLQRTTALKKIVSCSGPASLVFAFMYILQVETVSNLMLSWGTFNAAIIVLSWIALLTKDTSIPEKLLEDDYYIV